MCSQTASRIASQTADQSSLGDALTALLKAAADQLRLGVLRILRRDTFSVLELCQILDCSQPALSHHLKILAQAGLVATRKEGSTVFYRRAHCSTHPELTGLQQSIFQCANHLDLDNHAQEQLEQIYASRSRNSQVFFEEHAGEFGSQQEQMVAYSLYGPSHAELLVSQQSGGQRAVEVGPGQGEFLPLLSERYAQVIAVDNASAMLDKAQQLAASKQLDNIDFIQADTRSASIAPGSIDCVVMNMVLHHVPSPADIFTDVARWLRPGGVLSIAELCPHDQSWAREACGDLWLGLDPDDLSNWARDAGFNEGAAIYLAQKNGFRVQIRQFLKT